MKILQIITLEIVLVVDDDDDGGGGDNANAASSSTDASKNITKVSVDNDDQTVGLDALSKPCDSGAITGAAAGATTGEYS